MAQPAAAQGTNRYTNTAASPAKPICDTTTPCTNPMKRTFTVSNSYTIGDVNLGVLLTHSYRGDIVLALVSPAGTRVAVSNRVGGGGDNFIMLFDDAAIVPVANFTANDTITVSADGTRPCQVLGGGGIREA